MENAQTHDNVKEKKEQSLKSSVLGGWLNEKMPYEMSFAFDRPSFTSLRK